ncbi:hypothetical protein Hanom_Chr03g00183711 [Helianthus anomalus]
MLKDDNGDEIREGICLCVTTADGKKERGRFCSLVHTLHNQICFFFLFWVKECSLLDRKHHY